VFVVPDKGIEPVPDQPVERQFMPDTTTEETEQVTAERQA